MISSYKKTYLTRQRAFFLLLLCSLLPASGEVLHTVERKMNSYRGERTNTCLVIDGGVVPLFVPDDATLQTGGEIRMSWLKDGSYAIFRTATPVEAALFDIMDKPEGPAEWKKYLAATLGDGAAQYTLRDFQPDILAVNHWHMGAMSLDFSLQGVKSTRLLLLWRCADGTTITVTLQTGFNEFKTHCDQLYSMIGGSLLLEK
jgi:hypothetical protein